MVDISGLHAFGVYPAEEILMPRGSGHPLLVGSQLQHYKKIKATFTLTLGTIKS